MAGGRDFERAVAAIERRGALLVFPLENRREPPSLWHELHPRSAMRWAWDETGDGRVVALWRLREELATSGAVVYSKWFRNRATVFSLGTFVALLAAYRATDRITESLEPAAQNVLRELASDSPRSTKELRLAAGLRGRENEAAWQRALRELFARLLIVGVGEVDDGAFPSLSIGATGAMFDDLWNAAGDLGAASANAALEGLAPDFAKHHARVLRSLTTSP